MWKFLVCDDDHMILTILMKMIKKQYPDCYIATVESGKECIKLARKIIPDICIIDLRLPDLSGIEVCEKLKSDPLTRNVVILIITGAVNAGENKIASLDAGADAFLYKPVEYAQLISQLQVLVRIKTAEDELRKRACRAETNLEKLRILTGQLCDSDVLESYSKKGF